jgi:hypothetical protein
MLELELEWEGLEEAFSELEQDCTDIVRGMTVWAWNTVLQQTPQWSGAMAVSWSYSLNSPHYEDRTHEAVNDTVEVDGKEMPLHQGREYSLLHKGYMPNIEVANAHSAGNDLPFRLGDTVYISNGVQSEDDYAQAIEDKNYSVVNLRSANRPGAMMGRTLDRMQSMWNANGVTPNAAQNLKLLKIGSESRD